MIKSSDFICELAQAFEESYKCEDENFDRTTKELFSGKDLTDSISIKDCVSLMRMLSEFTRFSSIRTVCKVLQDHNILDKDIDVFNNENFRNVLEKVYCK